MEEREHMDSQDDDLLFPDDVGHLLNLSSAMVRHLDDEGKLKAIRVGKRGVRLFRRADVLKLKRERARRK